MFQDASGRVTILDSELRAVADCQDCRYNWSPRRAEAGESPSVDLLTTHRFDLYAHRTRAPRYVVIYRDGEEGHDVVFLWQLGGERDVDTVTLGPLSASLH